MGIYKELVPPTGMVGGTLCRSRDLEHLNLRRGRRWFRPMIQPQTRQHIEASG